MSWGVMGQPTMAYTKGSAVTPHDDTVIAAGGLWVGGAGDLVILPINSEIPITLSAVPAGTMVPIACTKVLAATTATLIVALG